MPEAVRAMVQFFSEHDYQSAGIDNPSLHAGVFVAADKVMIISPREKTLLISAQYEVSDLKTLALRNFVHSLRALKDENLVEELVQATTHAYASASFDASLRSSVVLRWCVDGTIAKAAAQLPMLVAECPDFGSDLILASATPAMIKAANDTATVVCECIAGLPSFPPITIATVAQETGLAEPIVSSEFAKLKADGMLFHSFQVDDHPDSWFFPLGAVEWWEAQEAMKTLKNRRGQILAYRASCTGTAIPSV